MLFELELVSCGNLLRPGGEGKRFRPKLSEFDVEMVNRIYSGFDGCDVKLSDNLDIM